MNIDRNYNLIPFLGITISSIVMVWFYFKGLDAANKYIMLFLISCTLFGILLLFINEHARSNVFTYLRFPFTGSTLGGATLLLLGQAVFLALYMIGKLAFGFNLTSLMIPLSTSQINAQIAQNAQQLALSASEPLQFFTSVMVAPNLEEFMFGMVWMVIAFALAALVYEQLTGKQVSRSNQNTVFFIALLLVMAGFAGIHSLNSTYVGTMFIVAAVFRGLMNLSIYKAGLFLSFTIGFHMMNNAVWYAQTYGATALQTALLSGLGFIIIAIEAVMLIIVINKLKKSRSFLFDIFRNLRGVV